MRFLSVKTIVRGASALALCASLSLGTALAYNGDPELAYTTPAPKATTSTTATTTPAQSVKTAAPVIAASASTDRLQQLISGEIVTRTVEKLDALAADAQITQNFKNLGSFRLSFYCTCEKCCGAYATGQTKSGTTVTEGRTIAVDPKVIPLGSRVYIDGYGVFIAEDVGSAIKENKIDIAVGNHEQALKLGIDEATVYLIAGA
ncbi:3D domain-containing protein [Butyricicoccus pullicaecorum]|uniref:3D domain-containing protein n=1 Tax=Butyricicoccus pullicaecorum TaxID=501571 RepID=UPI003990C4A6